MQLTRPRWAHVRRSGEPRRRVVGTVLALLVTLVAIVAEVLHAVPTTWQPTVVLASVAHYPMWVAPVGLVLALLVRRWATAVVAAAATVGLLLIQVPPVLGTNPPHGGRPLMVMQANLRLGSADPAPIVALVRKHRVDLLATEELTEPEQQRLIDAGLSRQLRYRYTVPSTPDVGNGIGLWSRYPISEQHFAPGFDLKVLTARVRLPGGRAVSFVAAHIAPPWPDAPTEWDRELSRLHRLLRTLPTDRPLVVAGDFNSTVDHAQFRALLDGGIADAAQQSGSGYLPTYPADRWFGPVIGIDHVLTRDAVGTYVRTVDLPNSDHRGLVARIVLRPAGRR